MSSFAWSTLLDILVELEERHGDDGLLSLGGNPSTGAIFVQGGRVCWVGAHGLQRRLRDLIHERAGVERAELDRVYERCRGEGRILGQTLVAEGWIQASDLRAALLRHSAESLMEICRMPLVTKWTPRRGLGYEPMFTFRPAELLLETVGLLAPSLCQTAQVELSTFRGENATGAAFVVDSRQRVALPLVEFGGDNSVRSLRELGTWATALPMATRELGLGVSFTLAATATGRSVLVWWREALLFALACADRSSAAGAVRHFGSVS